MRIAFCDDHTMLGEAMAVILTSRGHQVVACTTSPPALVAALAGTPVDVCLVDLHFPGGTAIPSIPDILQASPGARVVVLSGSSDADLLGQALVAGASGVVSKADDMDAIVSAIERVRAGEVVVPESALRAGLASAPAADAHERARFFTTREREVLERLVRGESTASMTETMGVRYSTVRTHIQNILTKLGVHSKLEAVALAVNEGIVRVNPPTPN